jgi:hypothetical protein
VIMYDNYDINSDFHYTDYFTYKNGMVDELTSWVGVTYKMQYDKNNKLISSKVIYGGEWVSTIYFEYKNNQVIKETWYNASTQEVEDIVTQTYNAQGKFNMRESQNYGYRVDITYFNNGDLANWIYYQDGIQAVKGEYSYEHHLENPFHSLNGIQNFNEYSNLIFGSSHSWYSSEKYTFFDTEGNNPEVYYENDPALTSWELNGKKFPWSVDYYDQLNQHAVLITFDYENCAPGWKNESIQLKPNNLVNRNISELNAKALFVHSPFEMARKMKNQKFADGIRK